MTITASSFTKAVALAQANGLGIPHRCFKRDGSWTFSYN